MAKNSLRKLTLCALLIALDIVITRFLSITIPGVDRIGFAFVVHALIGSLLGPLWGFFALVASDLLGMALFSAGQAIIIGLTLSAGVRGLLYGLLLYKKGANMRAIVFATLATLLVCDFALTPFFLMQAFGNGYMAIMAVKIPVRLVMVPIKIFLTYYVFKGIGAKNLNRFN